MQHRVETGAMKLGCLIAPTMADIRDVMLDGPSGLMAVAPPWCRPRLMFERRVHWPNGAWAICLSGEEPERARGKTVDTLWADELACWQRAESTELFSSRILARWPNHQVLDGLETLDLLLETGNLQIHPRCVRLKAAFQTYCRQRRGGQWIDFPADGHPEEDLIDALRGGVRDALPAANELAPQLPRVHAARVL
jgi:hypothetical protein